MSKDIYLAKNPLHKLFVGFDPLYNLKYLFVSIKEGRKLKSYKGSGKLWEKNIRYRREEIKKICIFKSRDPYIFMRKCVETSLRFNVVESDEWANQIIEMGNTGIGSPFGTFHPHKKECKHCKKSFDPGNFAQFHGNNCLLNPKRNSALPLIPVDTTAKRRLAIQRTLQKTRDFLESLGLPGVIQSDKKVLGDIYKKLILRYKDEVCFEWSRENTKNNIQLGFATFVRDMGEKPTKEDGSILYNVGVCRKDEELPYSKDNCYWGMPLVEHKSCKTYCDHCDRWVDKGNYAQFHGDKCKKHPDNIVESVVFREKKSKLFTPKEKHCEHCDRWFDRGNYAQCHGDKCKKNPEYDAESVVKTDGPFASNQRYCGHCDRWFNKGTYARYHGDKCKSLPKEASAA